MWEKQIISNKAINWKRIFSKKRKLNKYLWFPARIINFYILSRDGHKSCWFVLKLIDIVSSFASVDVCRLSRFQSNKEKNRNKFILIWINQKEPSIPTKSTNILPPFFFTFKSHRKLDLYRLAHRGDILQMFWVNSEKHLSLFSFISSSFPWRCY